MDEKDILSRFLAEDDADDILMHYGTDGMKWGQRRYQNEDGSLTPLGRIHYGIGKRREKKEAARVKKVEKLARSGDVDKILKNRKLFTREEMQDALTRAQNMERAKASGKSAQRKAEKEKKEREKAQSQVQKPNKQDMKKSKLAVDNITNTLGKANKLYATYSLLAKNVNNIAGDNVLPEFNTQSFKQWQKRNEPRLASSTDKKYETTFNAYNVPSKRENKLHVYLDSGKEDPVRRASAGRFGMWDVLDSFSASENDKKSMKTYAASQSIEDLLDWWDEFSKT